LGHRWLYQGLVPKVFFADEGEVAIWCGMGLSTRQAKTMVRAVGLVEVAIAAVTVARSHRRWPFAATAAAMPAFVIAVAQTDRVALRRAFNPVSLNVLGDDFDRLHPHRDVPFTISNDAYGDRFGRETMTWSRRFRLPRKIRAFDATMVFSERRGSSSTTSARTSITLAARLDRGRCR
jgi:hypothetical protein